MSAPSTNAGDGNSSIPERDLKNITKELLMQMGFDQQQYLTFKHESEQLCGQKMQPNARPANASTRAQLLQLAKTYLCPKWNPMVQRGLQEAQQERFWGSWMSLRYRYFSDAHNSNNWIQDTVFPDPAGSIPRSSRLLQSSPSARPTAMRQQTRYPPNESTTAPSQPSQVASRSPEWALSSRPRTQTLVRTGWARHAATGSNAVTWRDVTLKVSFGRMDNDSEQRCRPLSVPFARCVHERYIGADEGTKVIASWLDLSRLAMLIDDHRTQCLGGHESLTNNQHYILCAKFHDARLFKIRDSNEFHLAFNKWLNQRSSANSTWWISCVPPALLVDDSDYDIPNSEDPFFDPKSLKRLLSSDNNIDEGPGAKRARITPHMSHTKAAPTK